MAGMFDFKSAEQILAERQEKTRQNTLGLIKSSQEGMKSSEKAASNLGAMLTNLVISQFGGKSEAKQLKDARDMVDTTQAMEQAGVGGEGSSYGALVLKQAQLEEQERVDLLPEEMQEAIGEERQAKQLEQAFQNVDMNDPKQTAELVRLAVASGNTEAARLAVTFNKNALDAIKDKDGLTAKDVASLYEKFTPKSITAHLNDPNKPLVPISDDSDRYKAVGSSLFDTRLNKWVATPEDKGDSMLGNLNTSLYTPESVQAYVTHMEETGARDFSILNLIDPAQAEARKEQAKVAVKSSANRSNSFQTASSQAARVKRMQGILNKGLRTGFGASTTASIKRTLSALTGESYEGLAEAELFNALGNQLALLIRNPDSGMGLPGATSNRDLTFLLDGVATLNKSPEGNLLILDMYEKTFNMQKDVIDLQNELIKENGGIPPLDIDAQLSEFVSNYELLDEKDYARIQQMQGGDESIEDTYDAQALEDALNAEF